MSSQDSYTRKKEALAEGLRAGSGPVGLQKETSNLFRDRAGGARRRLDVRGFNEVRGYIFGDWAAEQMRYPPQGVPDFAGYAMGYRVVRAFLARTGMTAVAATYLPWREIVEQSGYF